METTEKTRLERLGELQQQSDKLTKDFQAIEEKFKRAKIEANGDPEKMMVLKLLQSMTGEMKKLKDATDAKLKEEIEKEKARVYDR
jgi:hypothetical protein